MSGPTIGELADLATLRHTRATAWLDRRIDDLVDAALDGVQVETWDDPGGGRWDHSLPSETYVESVPDICACISWDEIEAAGIDVEIGDAGNLLDWQRRRSTRAGDVVWGLAIHAERRGLRIVGEGSAA